VGMNRIYYGSGAELEAFAAVFSLYSGSATSYISSRSFFLNTTQYTRIYLYKRLVQLDLEVNEIDYQECIGLLTKRSRLTI
jgi:hypothetical protein